ncbi:hypothetical protein [Neisseria sp.]|uniref:hypothetical protein n=1 Tax=Neisseria sp. TaxID=192066 RepID=UPI0035A0C92E
MDKILTCNTTGDIYSNGDVSIGNQTINYCKSIEWQSLEKNKQKILENIRSTEHKIERYPDDSDFKEELLKYKKELIECNCELEQFKHEIFQLAQKFSQIEINSERRKIAYQAFLDGKYSEARAILETEEAIQEHKDLLQQREYLKRQQEENEKKLKHKSEESILLAHLYMIYYSLGNDRINKVKEYFELAIKEHDIPKYRLEYARFLYINNDLKKSEEVYVDTLNKCEELALRDKKENAIYLIWCLKDFAGLLQNYPNRWNEAEQHYCRAISIYDSLMDCTEKYDKQFILLLKEYADLLDYCARYQEAEKYYNKCLKSIEHKSINDPVLQAMVFHDFGIMLAKNPKKFDIAESLHKQALQIRRTLPENQLEALEHLIYSLKSLGKLLSDYPDKYNEAKEYFEEALAHLEKLIENESIKYQKLEADIYSLFAMLLNNIWEKFGSNQNAQQAKKYYEKAIFSFRDLDALAPNAYDLRLALALNNYGTLLQYALNDKVSAKKMYEESLNIFEKIYANLSANNSDDIQDSIAMVKNSLANLYSNMDMFSKAAFLYKQVLDIRIDLVNRQPDVYLKNLKYCLKCVEQSGIKEESLQRKYEQAVNLLHHINA